MCLVTKLSRVWLFVTPWTIAHQALLSMGFQARILEWVVMPSSRGSSRPRVWTQVSRIAGIFFTVWATRETPFKWQNKLKKSWNDDVYLATSLSSLCASLSLPTASVVEWIDLSCIFCAPNKICHHGGHASEGGSCFFCIYLPIPPAHRLGPPGQLRLGMMALAASPCCSGTSSWALHSHLAVPSF